ncbi:MAG: PQQ-binding-like beta-propeller repeat protein [Planctomycetota bacterium]|nr:PQQ-binding-like beta-propeller repeat protein [Planctomycetota bacterium]
MTRTFTMALVLAGAAAASAGAADTVGWRNDWTGRFPEAQPPQKWSKTEAVVWTCALPAWSNACPVIAGDRIFVCAEPDLLFCVNKETGAVLWKTANPALEAFPEDQRAKMAADLEAAKGDLAKRDELRKTQNGLIRKARTDETAKKQLDEVKKEVAALDEKLKGLEAALPPKTHPECGHTAATPVFDGKHVYAMFNSGAVVCYDLDGKRQWMKLVDRPWHDWGNGSSPLLAGGKLILHYNNLVALNPETGEEAWRVKDCKPSFGTPAVATIGGEAVIVTPVGDFVKAADGKVLCKGKASNQYNGPLIADGVAYFLDENGAVALELPKAVAEPFDPKVLWKAAIKRERYYASPILQNGLLFAVTRYGDLSVVDAKSGEIAATKNYKDLDANGQPFYPSLTLAGANLYVNSEHGKTAIVEPTKELKEIGRCDLEDGKATPVFEGTRMYVRGRSALYCIGK